MTPLEHLAAAIEEGTVGQFRNLDSEFGKGNGIHAKRAYNGSLDAAKFMHDRVLPGWGWEVGITSMGPCVSQVWKSGRDRAISAVSEIPARAWLLAIVRALIAQETKE